MDCGGLWHEGQHISERHANGRKHTRVVPQRLINMTQAWNKAILSDDGVEEELALGLDEIEEIAR